MPKSIKPASNRRSSQLPVILTMMVLALAPIAHPAFAQIRSEGRTSPVIPGRLRSFDALARTTEAVSSSEDGQFLPPYMEAPETLFTPPIGKANSSAPRTRISRRAVPPTLSTPLPRSSFMALEDNDRAIPPDTQGAIGPNHLMTTLNSQVRIQSRTGATISTVSLRQFWTNLVDNVEDTFDPRVHYDIQAGRWIFITIANGRSVDSAVLAAVSETSDPTGNWYGFKIPGDPDGLYWADFPYIGVNSKWIAVSTTLFSVSANKFGLSRIYLLNKDSVYSNGAVPFAVKSFDDEGGSNLSPSIDYDGNQPNLYLVSSFNGNSSGKGFLRLCTIEGAIGSEVYTGGTEFPAVSSTWGARSSPQDIAPQLGTDSRINNGDHRISSSIALRNGALWFCHNVFLPADVPTRSSIQWWELDLTGGIRQFGRIDDPSGSRFYAFPSLAVNKNNDLLIGYSRFAADQFASANYSFRAATDPIETLRADTVLKEGEAAYVKDFGGTRNRWGDYSSTVVDPANEIDLWTLQQYAASPANTWGTWWGRFALEAGGVPPAITSLNPASGGVGTVVTLSGSKFIDTTGVTFNGVKASSFQIESSSRLIATVPAGATTGPITVSTLDGTATSPSSFSVLPTPSITSFFPNRGAANASVQISGLNFGGTTAVQFNSIGSPAFTVDSASQITAQVPDNATTGSITVTTPSGTTTSSAAFTVTLEPAISSVSPLKLAAGGTVVILGANFTDATAVLFAGQNAAEFAVDSITQISATLPPGATGGTIEVITPHGNASSTSSFLVVSEPAISSFTPTDGLVGTSVTITGSNLDEVTQILFGQSSDPNFAIDSSRQITARVPPGTTTGLIRAVSPGGTATSLEPFVVVQPPANDLFANPTLLQGTSGTLSGSNVAATKEIGEPDHADSTGGRSVWYSWTAPSDGSWNIHTTGSAIDTTLAVYTGSTVDALTLVASNDDADDQTVNSSIVFSATAGTLYHVAVAGFRDTSGTIELSWINVAASPVIDRIVPQSGPPGGTVLLLGANFTQGAEIKFNTQPVTEFTVESPNRISVRVPAEATTGPVSITTPQGNANSSTPFTVTAPVANDLFANALTIEGSSGNLTGNNSGATFEPGEPAHADAPAFKSLWYRWTAPENGIWTFDTLGSAFDTTLAVYTGNTLPELLLVISNDDAQGSTSSSVSFVAFANSDYHIAVDGFGDASGSLGLNWTFSGDLPQITSFAPVRAATGATIAMTGKNFTAETAVHFNDLAATSVSFSSESELTVIVPAGATTGPIRVTTPRGNVLSATYFVVTNSDAPANDLFSSAQQMTGAAWVVNSRTVSASKEPGEPDHADDPGGRSIWYRWTAPETASYTVASHGSSLDTTLAIYTGDTLDALKLITASDDADGVATSKTNFRAVAGTEYRIALDGYGGVTGSVILKLVPTAPSTEVFSSGFESSEGYTLDQPLVGQSGWNRSGAGDNLVIQNPAFGPGQQARIGFSTEGDTRRFSVWHPLTNSLPVVEFTVSLMIVPPTNNEYDFFDWSVFNLDGKHLFSIDFDVFGLFVSYELDDGEGLLLSNVEFETGRVYQLKLSMDFRNNSWSASLDENLIADNQVISSTGAALNLGFIDAVWFMDETPGNNVMIFDDYLVTAKPNSPPVILAHPATQSVSRGSQAVFGVTTRGTEPIAYQWKLDGRNLAGATNAVLVLNNVLPTVHSGTYTAEASNAFGSTTSQPATLTVNVPQPPQTVFLELSASKPQADGTVPLTLKSTTGLRFSIQVSTDLINWTEITSGVNTEGLFLFNDPETQGYPERFFRALQIP
jgi:hypothetical protein